eukprot:Skav222647  [mRNA]  locus=scaffold10:462694:474269:- [translate_table: standard]
MCSFAAILTDGSVVTWGRRGCGDDNSRVRDQLRSVQQIFGARAAFSAITWDMEIHVGSSSGVQDQLGNVRQIFATQEAFAAVLADGGVVTWGNALSGGDSSEVQAHLKNVYETIRESVGEGTVLCLPCFWADWHHRGRMTSEDVTCYYVGIEAPRREVLYGGHEAWRSSVAENTLVSDLSLEEEEQRAQGGQGRLSQATMSCAGLRQPGPEGPGVCCHRAPEPGHQQPGERAEPAAEHHQPHLLPKLGGLQVLQILGRPAGDGGLQVVAGRRDPRGG